MKVCNSRRVDKIRVDPSIGRARKKQLFTGSIAMVYCQCSHVALLVQLCCTFGARMLHFSGTVFSFYLLDSFSTCLQAYCQQAEGRRNMNKPIPLYAFSPYRLSERSLCRFITACRQAVFRKNRGGQCPPACPPLHDDVLTFYRLLLDKLLGLVRCVVLDDVGTVGNLGNCVLALGDERTVERVDAHIAVGRECHAADC